MHSNKYLYKIHSVHHRLHVPYAFGASYSHPIEGLLIDCLSMIMGETVAKLSVRQTLFLCTISSIKAVDDHCGYKLPYDPFQMFSGNTADFHDIHHQVCHYVSRCVFALTLIAFYLFYFHLGSWGQIQFLTTFLCSLGCNPGHSNIKKRH